MLKRLLVYGLLLVTFGAKGQVNLVPNPSFEDYTICPNGQGQFSVNNWYSPSYGSPDYFNVCSINAVTVPTNIFGTQNPNSGNGYAGIGIYDKSNFFIEYIASELLTSLASDKVYCISLNVSLSEISEYSINNLGIFFSNDSQFYNVGFVIPEVPQVVFHQSMLDSIGWITLNGYYTATGGEKYITIGNFYQSPFNAIKIKENNNTISYIYIDDVSVIECNIPDIEAIAKPDVFTPNNDGVNETFEIQFLPSNSQLTIYNRWGNQVYTSTNYQNNWDGANCADGVYYYILTLPSGNTTKGTITILRD